MTESVLRPEMLTQTSRRASPRLRSFLTACFTLAAFAIPSAALATDPIYENWRGLAIRGTDPVAYFTEGKPVDGSSDHTFEYMGATWRFSTAANRAAFLAEPEKFAPKFGGYCAWAVSQGYTASTAPEAWTIVDGKLYLNYSKSVMKDWLADRDAFIVKANKNWPGIRDD